jgi:hypothetical protein
MTDAQKFSYRIIDRSLGMVDRMPYLPLTLSFNGRSSIVEGVMSPSIPALSKSIARFNNRQNLVPVIFSHFPDFRDCAKVVRLEEFY